MKRDYTRTFVIKTYALVLLCAFSAGCGHVGLAVQGKDQRTPLEKAAQAGDLAEVRRLLSSGADANDRTGSFGSPPLNAAALRSNNVQVIRVLIAAGANPNGRAPEGKRCWSTPLSSAAYSGDVENTRTLLDAGASIQQPACLKLVAGYLKPAIIDLLVQHGFDLLAVDENGRNELHAALAPPVTPNLDGIEYLLRAGVALNARDHAGKTPLQYWREPRDFEARWLTTWVFEHLSDDSWRREQRGHRAEISALLEKSGAL